MRAARFAWFLAALTLVNEIADTLITAAYRPLFSEDTIAVHGWPLNAFAVVGSATMGALIISRYPRHPVGWLLSAVGAGASVSLVSEAYSIWVLDHGGPGSDLAGHATAWLSLLIGGPYALTLLSIMFLIAPDGTLLSRRWRYAGWISGAGLACFVVGLLLIPGISAGDMVLDEGETGGATIDVLFAIGLPLITVGLTASVASLVVRMRRATGILHQQLRWIIGSGVFLPAGLIWRQVVQGTNGGEQTWLATLPLLIAYCCIPIFTALAILRYRLYDIELILNRAVVLAISTLFVAVGYTALVVGLGGEVGSRAGGFWASLLATAAVALAFQPLRSRVSRLADRFAYGSRALPYEALADFSQRLGGAVAPDALLPSVAEAAGAAVGAHRCTATLFVQGIVNESATWPSGTTQDRADREVLVRDGSGPLGVIGVQMPPGRGLREAEAALLQDLADQAGVAFRNASLDADSKAKLAALDLHTKQLAASRRRLVEARDSERRRLAAGISREVFPVLDGIWHVIDNLAVTGETGPEMDVVEQLQTDVATALELLRDVSRGVFPRQLEHAGIGPALTSYLKKTGADITLEMHPSVAGRRFGQRAEAAAYFCCVEAAPDCAGGSRVVIAVEEDDLVVHVTGIVGDGMDVEAVNDRVEALAGSLELRPDEEGSVLTLRVPIAREAVSVAP